MTMTNLQLTAHAFLARHTLAHFECHSSHRGLAFGVDSPAPGASTLGVESYPFPNEVDCLNDFDYLLSLFSLYTSCGITL